MGERQYHGFTLVELLVLIGVCSLLLAILIPTIHKARSSAQQVVCARIMRQWGTAFQIYVNDNKGWLPWAGYGDGNLPDKPIGPWADMAYWANALPPLMNKTPYYEIQAKDAASGGTIIKAASSSNMFVCPAAGECSSFLDSDSWADGVFRMWGNPEGSAPQYIDPPDQSVLPAVQRKVYWSYVMNSKLDNSVADSPYFGRIDHLMPSSELIVAMVEKCMNPQDVMPGYERQSLMRGKTTWTRFTTRHYGGGNLLFLDGHVEYLKAVALAAPRGHGYYKGEASDESHRNNLAYNLRDTVVWDPNQSPLFPFP